MAKNWTFNWRFPGVEAKYKNLAPKTFRLSVDIGTNADDLKQNLFNKVLPSPSNIYRADVIFLIFSHKTPKFLTSLTYIM